jgi:hypothetical protein
MKEGREGREGKAGASGQATAGGKRTEAGNTAANSLAHNTHSAAQHSLTTHATHPAQFRLCFVSRRTCRRRQAAPLSC